MDDFWNIDPNWRYERIRSIEELYRRLNRLYFSVRWRYAPLGESVYKAASQVLPATILTGTIHYGAVIDSYDAVSTNLHSLLDYAAECDNAYWWFEPTSKSDEFLFHWRIRGRESQVALEDARINSRLLFHKWRELDMSNE